PPSHRRRTARFCSGLAPAHRVRPRATNPSRLDSVHLRTHTPHDRRGGTSLTMRRHLVPGPPKVSATGCRRNAHFLVGVSRTESTTYTDWQAEFIGWHPGCLTTNVFQSLHSAPEPKARLSSGAGRSYRDRQGDLGLLESQGRRPRG